MSMDQTTKNAKLATPMKCTEGVRPKASENMKSFENSNPNFKPSNSPQLVKSTGRLQRSAVRNPNPVIPSPSIRIKERKFVVAKKKKSNNNTDAVKVEKADPDCKCKGNKINGKCLCVAYETLRSSQEDFNRSCKDQGVEGYGNEGMNCEPELVESPDGPLGSSSIKRRRDKLMEEARESVPEPGLGRVFHLVQAFEKLLTLPKTSENNIEEEGDDGVKKGMKLALPGLQMPKAPETLESSSSFCPDDLVFTAESLGLGSSQVSSSFDGSQGSSRRSSTGSVRSRRTSSVSSRNVAGRKLKKKKQLKATSQKPFKLRTEERGKEKEEEFFKKLQEITIQEEKLRIPIAQGLPLTTDEPEIPIKPSVKECTRPLDIKLYSDVRAVERSDFDSQVAEKMTLIELYRMERERLQKMAEEEEVRRLRKEQVPKAQPMPYFDRPFLPKRSAKQPTIPREPKFHAPPHHKKMKPAMSWNDFNMHTNSEFTVCTPKVNSLYQLDHQKSFALS